MYHFNNFTEQALKKQIAFLKRGGRGGVLSEGTATVACN